MSPPPEGPGRDRAAPGAGPEGPGPEQPATGAGAGAGAERRRRLADLDLAALARDLKAEALRLGLDAVGITDATPPSTAPSTGAGSLPVTTVR